MARSALSILYVGTESGTCLGRARALESLGHRIRFVPAGIPRTRLLFTVHRVGHHLGRPPDLFGANREILSSAAREPFDLLWVDRGREIRAATLRRLRRIAPGLRMVSYSPDDMMSRHNTSVAYRACIPLYDLHVTTKSYNVEELRALGAREVFFVDKGYDPGVHRPIELTAADRERFACDVGFVGYFEEDRSRLMLRLAEAGIPVAVHGPRWSGLAHAHPNLMIRGGYLDGDDYARAICATRINLGFLRKSSRDLQTARSVEIPACAGFMLAERTDEHLRLFEEGVEAEYFASFDELLEKCRYYLAHETERAAIAAAGRRRCLEGRYDNAARLTAVLDRLRSA
ncbi:MAG TPA: glycosyltransferase [Myxococcota bacterium]